MSQPKFAVGQRVICIPEYAGAVVLVVEDNDSSGIGIIYCVKYDGGATAGNDGTGWWPEDCLEPESI